MLNASDKIAAVNTDRRKWRWFFFLPSSERLCLYLGLYSVCIELLVIIFIKETFELSFCLSLQSDWQLRAWPDCQHDPSDVAPSAVGRERRLHRLQNQLQRFAFVISLIWMHFNTQRSIDPHADDSSLIIWNRNRQGELRWPWHPFVRLPRGSGLLQRWRAALRMSVWIRAHRRKKHFLPE